MDLQPSNRYNWNESHEIPSDRRRGSAGAVVHNNKIYIIGGLQDGGHGSGSTSYDWFDEYDPVTGQWKVMPSAPRKSAIIIMLFYYNNKIYLTGGRDTSHPSIINETVSRKSTFIDFCNRQLVNPFGSQPAHSSRG